MTDASIYRTAEVIYAMAPLNGMRELRRVVNLNCDHDHGSRERAHGLDCNARLMTALRKLNDDRGTTPVYYSPVVLLAEGKQGI